ncbi:MAG: NAD-dependent epimerase/dehydratase family protein [Elusimicrobia bacterium]|nr:NAD-dependent epimerase/dehydratase family protein [Elusimicrobiota bacterium]
MKVLVTGGAGLIGSHCAEYYAKKNCEVIVLDNLMRSHLFGYDKESVEYNWNYLSNFKNIKRVKGDVRNEEDVKKALGDGVDAVVHTAGQPGVPLSVRIPREDFSINAYGTLNVLECVRNICPSAAFVYCSTNKVYGENVDEIQLEEEKTRYVYKKVKGVTEKLSIDHTGHTPYGASKYVGDLYTQEYAHIYGMKTAVFRMSCIYGTRQFGFEDQGWVAWFIIANLTSQPLTIYGDGKQVRDLLYADDVVAAYDAFIKSDIKHCVWNIGGGPDNTISLIEFLTLLKKEMGSHPPVTYTNWRPSDQKVYISDISKVQKDLKWKPLISPAKGISNLIEWAKGQKDIFKR